MNNNEQQQWTNNNNKLWNNVGTTRTPNWTTTNCEQMNKFEM
jgi:hypothetical protein